MREYELYIPLTYNDGSPVEPERLQQLRASLVEHFGGLTHFHQENEGLWKVGGTTFRDQIVILRVLAENAEDAEKFLAGLARDIQREWRQNDVLIVARDVRTI